MYVPQKYSNIWCLLHNRPHVKYAVTQMIKLYVNSVKKFDPRVFINDSYTGSGTEGRIPLFELRTNIIDAGYTVSSCSSAKISANKIDTALKNLSSW